MERIALGLTPPACPPAPLKKLDEVICGPGGLIERENVTWKLLTAAVTTAVPATEPACAVMVARPVLSVVATPPFCKITGTPVEVDLTCTFDAGPWALVS